MEPAIPQNCHRTGRLYAQNIRVIHKQPLPTGKGTTSASDENVGTRVFSTDEMTGIQALEHKYPDKLPMSGKDAKIEFEYMRHGTTSLIGFFDVVTDRVELS